ncbi:MAG TPA: TonB-dependent receptor [Flavisolibacter sp.]|nr:TonB-dependent receptor [Flavisolibacter sp.]
MRRLLLAFIVLLCTHTLTAQTPVKGAVLDTAEKKSLQNAAVSLLHKKDSTLYKFTRSDKAGRFFLADVKPGHYMLLITYPKFADYADEINVKTEPLDVGTIALTQRAQLLQAVIIRSAGAIRIKGDTTEFVADSFKVREGATVEELLKKLPGFQVNSKGEITAQGQRVQKVLVDGEEFFGDDPTMATKNISAKAVDKVQVFDNKTDQQQLTGLSSGSEGKTVNIRLKEDQKKGGFGRYSVATNFRRYTDANLLFNRFVGKKKLSLYGTKSNTSTGSINWQDQRRLGLNDFEFDEVSGYYMSFGSYDETFNDWNLRGLPNAYSAGGLYVNKFNADKQSVNTSYRYNRLGTRNEGINITQNILPDTLFYNNQRTASKSLNEQHAFNGRWEWKLDSLSTLRFTSALTHKTTTYQNKVAAEALSEEKQLVNSSDRETEGRNTRLQADNALQYKKLFRKTGRQLIANLRFNLVDDDGLGTLVFTNRFYKNGMVDSTETSDQQKINKGHSETFGGKITYAEPLSTKLSLIMEYGYNRNTATSNRNTYEKGSNGKYEQLNRLFSNNFDMTALSHSGSFISRFVTKKFQASLGSGVSAVQLALLNKDDNSRRSYNFLNLTPQSSMSYVIRPNNSIRLNYRGATVQPNLEQLQPLRNNNDPLNIVIGNPNLDVGFRHNISLSYNFYKLLSQTGLWTSFSYNTVQNAITNITTIDRFGKKTTMPVNVNGNRNWNFWGEWNKGEGEKKLIYSASVEANGGVSNNFINGMANRTSFSTFETGIGLRYEIEQKWSLFVKPKVGYSQSISSLNKNAKTSYLTYGGEGQGRLNFAKSWELRSELELDWRQRISAFDANPNLTVWNAEFSKKIFKNKSGIISLLAHDILNSNRGYTRVINSNFISEDRFQRIGQYFMLKLEWSFNKMGGEQ